MSNNFKTDYTERKIYSALRPSSNGIISTDLIVGGDATVKKKLSVLEDMDVSGTINIHGIVDLSGFGGKINDTIIGYSKPTLGSFTDLSAQIIIATNKVKAPLLEVETINYNYQNVTVNDTDMDISGNLDVSNNLDVSGVTVLHSSLDVFGATKLAATDISGSSPSDSTLDVSGATVLHSALDVFGATKLAATDISGSSPSDSTLDVSGTTVLHSSLDVFGATKLAATDISGSSASDSTLDVSGATVLHSSLGVTGATTLTGQLNLPTAIANSSASTFTVLDDNASAFSIGSTDKSDILKIISTNGAEGVSMSGTLNVAGTITLENNETITNTVDKEVIINAQNFVIGTGNAVATIKSNGNRSLKMTTGDVESNIFINKGTDGDIQLNPAGSGIVDISSDVKLANGKVIKVNNIQVVGAQQAAVTDCTTTIPANGTISSAYTRSEVEALRDAVAELQTQLNEALTKLRSHGLIAS